MEFTSAMIRAVMRAQEIMKPIEQENNMNVRIPLMILRSGCTSPLSAG